MTINDFLMDIGLDDVDYTPYPDLGDEQYLSYELLRWEPYYERTIRVSVDIPLHAGGLVIVDGNSVDAGSAVKVVRARLCVR